MLLVKIGYKTLLVWRCAQQAEEHIDKDEMMFVVRGAPMDEECRDEDVMLLIRIANRMLLVWRLS